MSINMLQSDRNFVSPSKDASLYSALAKDDNGVLERGDKFKLSTNGLAVTVSTGQAIIKGRLIEIANPETLVLPSNSSGSICIVIDLSKTNDVNGQAGDINYNVKVNQVYLASISGALTQDDLNNGGALFELPIGTYTTTATTATVVQNAPLFKDTGWLDLDIKSTGAVLRNYDNNKPFAQYRCLNDVMYIRWQGVDCTKANNTNQIGRVPWKYRPDVEFSSASIDFGVRDDGGQGNVIYPILAHINETTTLWVTYPGNHMGNLCGTISYPVPVGR